MEEKRNDSATQLAASSATTTATPPKASEIPAAEPLTSRRRGGGQKRKANHLSSGSTSTPPTTSSSKRQAREKPSAVPFPPIHNGPCTRARQQPSNGVVAWASDSDSPFSAAVVKSEVEAVAPSESFGGGSVKVEEKSSSVKEDWEALEGKIEAEYEVIRSRDANAHVVPIPSGWFSWTKVHPLEERVLPSFFNGKSETRTAEIYMEIRNWIMNKFHANPNAQIELKDLSELSIGELDARQEVMEFLDYWGLINYHPIGQTDSTSLSADADGAAKTSSLVEKLYHFEREQSCNPVVPRTLAATPTVPSRLFPESAIAEELVRPEGPAYHCNSCSADCSRKRYHCQKQADFDLCNECFNSGKFGCDMSPSDFILMEPAEAAGASGGKWTDQETLLLLEALELYKENWNEIAEHVATKTKAQCILHFVQMPIEDTFLDCDDKIDASLKENADPFSTNNDTSAPKDAPETTESKEGDSDNQLLPSPMEISKPENATEPKVCPEIGENCALKALREAFEAVGSLPSPEGHFSFAEADNPVMALAAFLVRLVEPNVVIASTHSSLKSILGNASGVQLAARHCFLLEDPPDVNKKSAHSERGIIEVIEQEVQEGDNQNDGKQEEDNSVFEKNDSSNDHANENNEDSVTEEKGLLVSPNGKCTDKSHAPKEPGVTITHEDVEPALLNESDVPDLPKEQAPSTVKESRDGASVGGPSQSTVAPKDEEMVSDSLPSENVEAEQPITSNSAVENGATTGEEQAKDCKDENKYPLETKNDLNIDKMKRAAVTAISAAAVKGKLLANHEEDQIRHLATFLIEKQLHKLETKLAFFTEMESVVLRVREQLERSKQRLYHERAQIIAARFGVLASSSRPMPQSLPTNRAAMTFVHSVPRPPMTMASQRPPISRSIMASAPPTSNPFAPATVAGNSVQPSNQEKFSSVGMK